MTAHDYFAGAVADRYDDDPAMFDPKVVGRTVDVLCELAARGPALEFAIGTGRIALPLAQRGISVSGVDTSPDMIAKLREKPGGQDIAVTLEDMTQVQVGEKFKLVYLLYNTINNLTTQEAQIDCFQNAAEHLEDGGHFVVEVMVPALRLLPPGQTSVPFGVTDTHWGLDEYDTTHQTFWSHHFHLVGGKIIRNSLPFRYVWPAELDLMARLSGLTLSHRWATWAKDEFTHESTGHISVWTKS